MESENFKRISKAAWLAGITVKDLCAAAGVDYSIVWRDKTGRQTMRDESLNKLIEAGRRLMPLNEHLQA